jgi:acetoacetyl-CoA reductase/3-oxoacyl-[acyl-carrier protein] reductase
MIIITGASKGLGRFLFKYFNEINSDIIGIYNSTTKGFEKDIDKYYKTDVSNYDDVKCLISKIESSLKKIVLLNCAGISYNSYAHKADIKKWDRVIDVNLKGSFYMIREVLPIMRKEGYGRIVNFSSVVTIYPTPGVSSYAASKSALLGLMKTLAVENASKGITINTINLGYVNIGMGINDVPDAYQKELKSRIPNGRFCDPEEVANTIEYIINTPYLNGSTIDLNGALV